MLNLEARSDLGPHAVIERAIAFFGDAGLHLQVERGEFDSIAFMGGGGAVAIRATRDAADGLTTVEILSREYDSAALRFAAAVAPPGPVGRLLRRLRPRRRQAPIREIPVLRGPAEPPERL